MAKETDKDSLIESLVKLTSQVAGGTVEFARNATTMTAMFGDNWLSSALLKTMEPERLEAMADAGRFLRDARETAGLSLKDLSESLGMSDNEMLKGIESGDTIMSLELMLRAASLLARHDPIPFLIKFMRTYNPSLGQTLEQWGVLALPKAYEKERRFVNLYRQHDALRALNDDEYLRFIDYVDSSISLVLDVMLKEKAASADEIVSRTKVSEKSSKKSPKSSAAERATKKKTKPKAKKKPENIRPDTDT
ncbi:MAG: transcriptional regulator with XRE-family HTH domain [Halioglobus sp.]|jgi:transcriptional regulator with XRE-family HTH domain